MGAKLYQVWLKRIYKKHNIYVGTPLDIKDDIFVYLTSFTPKWITSARIIDKVTSDALWILLIILSVMVNMNGVILIFTTLKNTIYLFLLNLLSVLLIIVNLVEWVVNNMKRKVFILCLLFVMSVFFVVAVFQI